MKKLTYSTMATMAVASSLLCYCNNTESKKTEGDQQQSSPGFIEYVAMDSNPWWDELETFSPPAKRPEHNLVLNQGLWGSQLIKTQLAKQVQSQVRFALEMESISCDQTKNSTVSLSPTEKDAMGIPRPVVNYTLPQCTLDGYAYAIDVANQLFAAAGIDPQTTVSSSSPGTLTFTTSDGKKLTIEYRGAGHLIGTHRMGDQPKKSAVNKDLQSWDHNNLYIVGCGVFPTTATSNPALTAAVLALRAADTITSRLKAT
jgi:glucose dehydrogenase